MLVGPCGVRIICHRKLLRLGTVRTRRFAVISWDCWYRRDRATGKVMVCLAVGRVVVLWKCRLRLVDGTGGKVVYIMVVVNYSLSIVGIDV